MRDVTVDVRVSAPVDVTWRALWDPVRLAGWFGDLDRPWVVGRAGRIDFGDGDFFVVTPTEIVEERLIGFEWTFLGVGPVNRIRWSVRAVPDGTLVLVEDSDPARGAAEAEQLVQGWTDFFARLKRFLETGQRSRYGWREDIDGSVELPGESFAPLRLESLYRWLPIASDGFGQRWFFVVDSNGPRRFQLDHWDLELDAKLSCSVELPGSTTTDCTVVVDGSRLRFTHTGWGLLPDDRGLALRQRFAKTWVCALEDARRLASAGS
ncbi:MAG: SRPBCC domain-containing protein [Actinobacteria bacterium]|nr:SRPBCC domain-containing protein [Acidobacteriota bacterium]MCA1719551.1 SRPBCC domain-containing protein [Actinomycetota bacterium]